MLQTKTEEQLIDEEDWELEQIQYNINEEKEKLPYLNANIDDLENELFELKEERDEIISIINEYKKGIKKIMDKRLDREYEYYLKVLWYKSIIAENQSTLDLWMVIN